ncbi:mitochondrial inner membrane protease ATP23 homolog isoform X2 [Tachyglossus aculeatus]|uniref:mitochondrial inner membrane protease ATP23 homolog isoform X2 n=1 Tax=Tachyglossus aculeatus TaxID=9261 RepID=UPI0018F6D7CD|nr:mitochondrial inner membrane protease ATP23 homolog isoform X2 [Tachyglossus aculeatus]
MLGRALHQSPYAKLLLEAMKASGCAVYRDRHFSCEDCNGNVSGGFDASTSQIVLCQNNIYNQGHMTRVVTHELIHAFDHCRAHVNWFTDVKHLACSETCVRERALRSILAVRKVSKAAAEKAVDEVFDSCFSDHEPFGRIPHSKKDAKYAYRDFQNRDRYYSNV